MSSEREKHGKTEYCFEDFKTELSPSKLGLITENHARLITQKRAGQAQPKSQHDCAVITISDVNFKSSLSSPSLGLGLWPKPTTNPARKQPRLLCGRDRNREFRG
jgi:hypothetical protein